MRRPADVFDLFADALLAQDGLWREAAACRGEDLRLFFPEDKNYGPAKKVCARCVVTNECRAAWEKAPISQQGYGVWGGVPGHTLVRLRRRKGLEDLTAP